MLAKRYENDGKTILNLNALQIEMKKQIESKISQGIYQFESVPCCICKSEDFELLSNKDRYGFYLPVVICKKCGLIQTNPRMTQESYNSFYNSEYRKMYGGSELPTREFFTAQYYKGQTIYSYLQKTHVLLKLPSQLFVFEVGCGTGGILKYFKDRGCRVHGIDLGEEYIKFGKSKYDLDLSAGTIADMSFDKSPDVIIYSHILEHILSPKDELKHIYRVLGPNGVVYMAMPGVKNLLNSYEMNFLLLLQNAHVYHFTLTTLRNLLETNGFQLLCGNETIKSVFKKNGRISSTRLENDYEAVMAYLRGVEKLRPLSLFTPCKLRSIIIKALKSFRIHGLVRKLYWKMKG